MGLIGIGNGCYLYVNGISVSKPIWLHDTVCLCPTKADIRWQEVTSLFESDIDFSAAVLCNRQCVKFTMGLCFVRRSVQSQCYV